MHAGEYLTLYFVPFFVFSSREYFNNRTLDRHLEVMSELIQRDKNHPSVVMWSVANEPLSQYEHVAEHLRYMVLCHRF